MRRGYEAYQCSLPRRIRHLAVCAARNHAWPVPPAWDAWRRVRLRRRGALLPSWCSAPPPSWVPAAGVAAGAAGFVPCPTRVRVRLWAERSPLWSPEPERPELERPELERPESERPESERPELERPVSERPESERPVSERPELERPESEWPDLPATASLPGVAFRRPLTPAGMLRSA